MSVSNPETHMFRDGSDSPSPEAAQPAAVEQVGPVEVATDLAHRLKEEAGGLEHQVEWKWPFLLARELRALGGQAEDYEDAIAAFAEESGMEHDDVYYGVL